MGGGVAPPVGGNGGIPGIVGGGANSVSNAGTCPAWLQAGIPSIQTIDCGVS